MEKERPENAKASGIKYILRRRVVISRTASGRWWRVVVKQGAGRPQEPRRGDDSPGADYTDERETEIDWRGGAPRWMLLLALVVSCGIGSMLGTMVLGLVLDRFQMIETAQRGAVWDALKAEQEVRIRQREEALRDMAGLNAQMAEIKGELRALNERLRRRGS